MEEAVNKNEIRAQRLEKLRFWRRACAEMSEGMAAYNASPDSRPFFFYHGDFDSGGLYFKRMAPRIGHHLISISPLGLQGEAVPGTIEGMARRHLADILAQQPQGPYRIGGYCNGAVIAYETARLLEEAGHKVEMVVLLEPSSYNAWPAYRRIYRTLASAFRLAGRPHESFAAAMNAVCTLARLTKFSPGQVVELARILGTRMVTRRQRVRTEAGTAERELLDKQASLTRVYLHALAGYLPPPTDTPVVVLSTGKDGWGRPSDNFDGTAWGNICRNFSHIRLPGHHSTCLAEHADVTAGHLADILGGKHGEATAATELARDDTARWGGISPGAAHA